MYEHKKHKAYVYWRIFALALAAIWLLTTLVLLIAGHSDIVYQSLQEASNSANRLRSGPMVIFIYLILGFFIYRLYKKRAYIHLLVVGVLYTTIQIMRIFDLPEEIVLWALFVEIILVVILDIILIIAFWKK